MESGQLIGRPLDSLPSSAPSAVLGAHPGFIAVTDRWVQYWRFDSADGKEIACRMAGRNLTEAEWAQFGLGTPPTGPPARSGAPTESGARERRHDGDGSRLAPTVRHNELIVVAEAESVRGGAPDLGWKSSSRRSNQEVHHEVEDRRILGAVAAVLALDPRRSAGRRLPRSAAPTTNTQEVEFTINWENCDELQEGSTIEGTGTLVSATVENVRRNGVAVARNSSLAVGTATDQAGNTYSWSYDNRFHAMSSADDPSSFTGTMVDEFLLAGDGPEHLQRLRRRHRLGRLGRRGVRHLRTDLLRRSDPVRPAGTVAPGVTRCSDWTNSVARSPTVATWPPGFTADHLRGVSM